MQCSVVCAKVLCSRFTHIFTEKKNVFFILIYYSLSHMAEQIIYANKHKKLERFMAFLKLLAFIPNFELYGV